MNCLIPFQSPLKPMAATQFCSSQFHQFIMHWLKKYLFLPIQHLWVITFYVQYQIRAITLLLCDGRTSGTMGSFVLCLIYIKKGNMDSKINERQTCSVNQCKILGIGTSRQPDRSHNCEVRRKPWKQQTVLPSAVKRWTPSPSVMCQASPRHMTC